MRFKYFIIPEIVNDDYTKQNYSRNLLGYIRMAHFEMALRMTSKYFHNNNAIDFGCAEGPFLQSVSKYYKKAIGIDRKQDYLHIASILIDKMQLKNVRLLCNDGMTILEQKQLIGEDGYKVLYILEALEHIGDRKDLYNSQIRFLNDLFQLIDDDGIIVISVPKMFGLSYLFMSIGLKLLRQPMDKKFSVQHIIHKAFFLNTEQFEREWDHSHEGYNYKKLEHELQKNFKIIHKRNIIFQNIYVIKR